MLGNERVGEAKGGQSKRQIKDRRQEENPASDEGEGETRSGESKSNSRPSSEQQ